MRALMELRRGHTVLQEADQSTHAAFLQRDGTRRRSVALRQVGQQGDGHLPTHLAASLADEAQQRGEERLLPAEGRRGEQQVHVAVLDAQLAEALQRQSVRRQRRGGGRVVRGGRRAHHPVQQPVQQRQADALRVQRQVQLARYVGQRHQRVLTQRRQAVPAPLQHQPAEDQHQAGVARQLGVVAGDEGEAAHDVGDAQAASGQRVLPRLSRGQRSLVPAARLVLQFAERAGTPPLPQCRRPLMKPFGWLSSAQRLSISSHSSPSSSTKIGSLSNLLACWGRGSTCTSSFTTASSFSMSAAAGSVPSSVFDGVSVTSSSFSLGGSRSGPSSVLWPSAPTSYSTRMPKILMRQRRKNSTINSRKPGSCRTKGKRIEGL
ncbi:hypothetical protein FQN60_015521 [Etheostoma spectabile]|uniref:Uncharacterized protein n=1 Tax=Etheostoma spectabile TaxID=54343 RepID=A0A5J5CQQ9_9PERO|nr:hypothetical protein FQN60_015521 [Etheostoma spectabile]